MKLGETMYAVVDENNVVYDYHTSESDARDHLSKIFSHTRQYRVVAVKLVEVEDKR